MNDEPSNPFFGMSILSFYLNQGFTFEQYLRNPQPVHFSNSFPAVSSTFLETTKHAEHVLSSNVSSRTEIKGSRRRRRDPAEMDCEVTRPLPREFVAVEVSICSREPESFEAVEAVTEGDAIDSSRGVCRSQGRSTKLLAVSLSTI